MSKSTTRTSPDVEMTLVRQTLEQLAECVVEQMRRLRAAAGKRDITALGQIVAYDKEVDDLEMKVGKLCRSFVELRAPLGPDFRYVMGAIDIARNLERIGDCIEYVARHV